MYFSIDSLIFFLHLLNLSFEINEFFRDSISLKIKLKKISEINLAIFKATDIKLFSFQLI